MPAPPSPSLDATELDPSAGAPSSVLVPAATTAARERARLELAAGRTGPARWLAQVVPSVRNLGSAEAAERGLRYRPVAWTVIAVAAVALHLPGRDDQPTAPETAAAQVPAAVAPVPSEPAAPADPPQPVLSTPTSLPSFSPGPVVPGPSPVTPVPPAASSDGTTPTSTAADPLSVRGFGWASRLPASPVPVDEVAEGTAPVGNRLGSVDRVSFLRLDGGTTTLVLEEDADSARELLGPAMVAACPITDATWAEEPGQSFDDAPQWDAESCVAGAEDDGTWTFDLGSFADPTGDTGFALVPTTEAPADFQIAFRIAR